MTMTVSGTQGKTSEQDPEGFGRRSSHSRRDSVHKRGTRRARVTFECVEGFAGPDGGQGLFLVKLVVEVRGQHLPLTLLTLLLRVTAIRAAQERKPRSNYSDCPAKRSPPAPPTAATKATSGRPACSIATPRSPRDPRRRERAGPASRAPWYTEQVPPLISRLQNCNTDTKQTCPRRTAGAAQILYLSRSWAQLLTVAGFWASNIPLCRRACSLRAGSLPSTSASQACKQKPPETAQLRVRPES